jgi:hypothetical protein
VKGSAVREVLFGLTLLIASLFIVIGVAHYAPGVAWAVAGVLLAALGWLVLADDGDDGATPPDAPGVDL